MKRHTMSEAKNDICSIIREAEAEEVLITRHGKPAAVVIGFQNEDDWFDYKMEHDEKFLKRIAKAREEIRQGRFVELDELPD
jgi:prevent-host-death family protein